MKIEFENLSADELRALASMLTQWADLRDKQRQELENLRIAAMQNIANPKCVAFGDAAFGHTSALANSILQPR